MLYNPPVDRYTTELALGDLKRTAAPKKSLRVVFFQRVSVKLLQFDVDVAAALTVKLAGGHRFKVAVINSEAQREELLRECKRRRESILLIVETGHEKIDLIKARILFLLHSGVRYLKRMTKSYHRVQPRLSPGACGIC